MAERAEYHVVLESPGFQLVVHGIPPDLASTSAITVPPARRGTAAIKPVFFVANIGDVRAAVRVLGGVMDPVAQEWSFQGATVCDGLDPEGNVIQFRAVAKDTI